MKSERFTAGNELWIERNRRQRRPACRLCMQVWQKFKALPIQSTPQVCALAKGHTDTL